MSRLFHSGFEWNSTLEQSSQSGAAATISSTTKRTGGFAGRINAMTSGTSAGWRWTWQSSVSNGPFYIRFYLLVHTLPATSARIMHVNGSTAFPGSPQARFQLSTTGVLQPVVGGTTLTASSAINLDQWYRVELFIDRTAAAGSQVGTWRLDGVQIGTSSAVTYAAAFQSLVLGGNLAAEAGTTADWFFDDIAINDTNGSTQNSWPGDGGVIMLLPNATGDGNTFATQTGGTAGAGNGYTRVNEMPPDDATSFNGSSTLNEEDFWNCANSGINSYDIVNVVAVSHRQRNSVADTTGAVKYEVKKTSGGTIAQGSAVVPNSTTWITGNLSNVLVWTYASTTDPDGGAWSQSTLDSAQVGYKLTTAPAVGGRRIDVTHVALMVDYSPGTPPAASGGSTLALMGAG